MLKIFSAIGRLSQARRRKSRTADVLTRSVNPDCRIARIEGLESRELLSASINSAGWTVVTPPRGARVIYVSSSRGNDRNSGLSASSPVKSIGRAESMIRNNSADEMLLKRGDTFNSSLGFWTRSGMSPQNPIVVGAYGSGSRPTLATGNSSALVGGGATINNLDIIGIRMYPNARRGSGPDGISIDSRASNILIENCDIQGYHDNIIFEKYFGPITNITIRRSNVSNAWSGNGSHSEGAYFDGVNGLTLQDNVFDHDGWNPSRGGWATMFNQAVYVTAFCSNLTAVDNIFSNASNFGLEARCGGKIQNNLFYNDADGLSFGLVDGSPVTAGGVSGSIIGNVFIGSHAIGRVTYGNGVMIGNINRGGVVVSNNLFENNSVGKVAAINLEVGASNSNFNKAVGLNNVKVQNNVVYNWYEGLWVQGGLHPGGSGPYAINNVTVSGNRFSRTHSSSVGTVYRGEFGYSVNADTAFPNPNLSLASYASRQRVGSSDAAFLAAAAQSGSSWNTSLTAAAVTSYLRSGFGV